MTQYFLNEFRQKITFGLTQYFLKEFRQKNTFGLTQYFQKEFRKKTQLFARFFENHLKMVILKFGWQDPNLTKLSNS